MVKIDAAQEDTLTVRLRVKLNQIANSSGMRGVINLPTYGFYVENAVATERFEPKDYVVLGGTWQGRAHAEFSPKPPYQYIKWSGEVGGVVTKIAVVNDDIYLGVNYNVSTGSSHTKMKINMHRNGSKSTILNLKNHFNRLH